MNKIFQVVGMFVIFGILLALISALFFALPVKWIWNCLFEESVTRAIFGVEKLNFWRALCLCWLCSILFKSSVVKKN